MATTDSHRAADSARLLFVHAHPDDESITTGGTIAHYANAGAAVTVLTCTLGEEGEVIGGRWAGLTSDRADQLGGYRIHELSLALAALGAAPPTFLGGGGRWRDSGMAGTPTAQHPRAFVNADHDDAVREMVTVIRALRPHVVVGYDPAGTYGHPDHVQVHVVATAAVAESGSDQYPDAGAPWYPAKFYWTATESSALAAGLHAIDSIPAQWRMPEAGELASLPDSDITTVVDVSSELLAKVAALRAHATQVTVAPSGTEFALSNNVVQPILTQEHFVLVRGEGGEREADGRECDLLSGIDLA